MAARSRSRASRAGARRSGCRSRAAATCSRRRRRRRRPECFLDGGPEMAPTPPNIRDATAEPWRPSIPRAPASSRVPRRTRMTYQNLIVERAAHVATLTLNRPEAYNALDLALGRELFQASLELDEDPDVRCVVI